MENVPLQTKLEIVAQAAEALQAAHDSGIIHRDVKPGNILVSSGDGVPDPVQVKLTDFGIGQVVSTEVLAGVTRAGFTQTMLSSVSSQTGTHLYMAPELLAGKPASTRSDTYSLGVVLYQLLVGDLGQPLTVDWSEAIPDALLRDDLKHCLAGAPEDRLTGAAQLAENLRTFDQRKARQVDLERLRRLRLRVVASAVSIVALLVVLGVLVGLWRGSRNRTRLAEALLFQQIAEELAIKEEYGDSSRALAHAIASLEREDTWARRRLALAALWKGPTRFRLPRADELKPAGDVSFSPDGKVLATGSRINKVLLWPSDGGDPEELSIAGATRVLGAKYSPDGKWLLSNYEMNSSRTGPYQGVLWDAVTREKRLWDSEAWAPYWFHPDGTRLLAYSLVEEGTYPGVAWWPIEGTEVTPLGWPRAEAPIHLMYPPYYMSVFYPSADLRWLVSWQGTNVYISSIDAESLGDRILVGSHERPIQAASLDAKGQLISSADHFEMRIWSRANPDQCLLSAPAEWTPAIFDRLPSRVFTAWPDGNRMAVSYDLRGPVGSKPLPFFPAQEHPDEPRALTNRNWVAIGSGLLSGSPREVSLYPVRGVWPFHVDLKLQRADGHPLGRLAPQDGRHVALGSRGEIWLFDLESPDLAPKPIFESPEQRHICTAKFDHSGKHLLVGTLLSGAWLVPLQGGESRRLKDAPNYISALAFSSDSKRVAVGGDSPLGERLVRVLDLDGQLLANLDGGRRDTVHDIEFLTETEMLVATEGALRWWSTESKEVRVLSDVEHSAITVSASYFVSKTREDVWLYDRATLTGKKLKNMEANAVTILAIAPNESFVVAGYSQGAFRVRHLDEDRPHYLPGVEGAILDLWIDPRGYWITAITSKGQLTYWPIPRGRPLDDHLPLEEFLDVLRAQTNIRVVVDADSPDGYRETTTKFPGWEKVPCWQEWYSENYMEAPPWKPMLDLEALKSASFSPSNDRPRTP